MSNETGIFNIGRALRLVRHTLWQDRSKLVLSLSLYAGFFVVLGPSLGAIGARTAAVWLLYRLALLGGCIYTAGIFAEIHDKLQAPRYLMIPASATEKLASRWLVSGLLYPLVVTALGVLMHQATFFFNPMPGMSASVNGVPVDFSTPPPWTLFPEGGVNMLLDYYVLHSAFFFGAVFFSSNQFLKTALIVCGIAACVLVALLVLNFSQIFAVNPLNSPAHQVADSAKSHLELANLEAILWIVVAIALPPALIVFANRALSRAEA